MKTSDINSFFSGNIEVIDLKNSIQQDVENYSFLMKNKGSTIPLNFCDDESILINQTDLKKLLLETINGNINNIHLAYICDCLTLVEDIQFENEKISNLIYEIADPEVNGGYKSIEELEELIKDL